MLKTLDTFHYSAALLLALMSPNPLTAWEAGAIRMLFPFTCTSWDENSALTDQGAYDITLQQSITD